jgi:dipeptidase
MTTTTLYLSVSILRHFTGTILLTLLLLTLNRVKSCTDILVTPGASVDGSAIIAYNADSPTLMGMLYHYPASQGNDDKMLNRSIYDWDSGRYMGEIDEANCTYNVVGNTNEYGLIIGETTFGGVSVLAWNQTDAIMDYGSLIYVTLQRSKTVHDAIETMVDLMDTYGYASGGESFSLADQTGEVWMMEVISRGNDYKTKGAVWVAQRIPDGMVAAHANQARITTFPRDDPENFLYAPDVVDVAVHYNLYPADADPVDFSFSDVYDPLTFIEARQGEARVWSIFSHIVDADGIFEQEYLQYALGQDLSRRMPLYVKPYQKLSVSHVIELMSSHYEDTPLDSSIDVGGGLFESPYRPRPLEWTYMNQKYHNERNIATAKTGWNFIGQVRPWMPPALSSIVWFACDDSSTSPRVPVYGSAHRLSPAYYGVGPQDGVVQPLLQFDLTKAFWVQNMVSNFAYSRWNDIYPIVQQKLLSIHDGFMDNIAIVDQRAIEAYDTDSPQAAVDFVTLYTVNAGNTLHKIWMEFYGELFVKFRDYYTIVPKESDPLCGCEAIEPGLSELMKKRIVEETGEHYRVLNDDENEQSGRLHVLRGENGPPKRLYGNNLKSDALDVVMK